MSDRKYSWSPVSTNLNTKKIYEINAHYAEFEKWAEEQAKHKTVSGFRQGSAPVSMFKEDWINGYSQLVAQEIVQQEGLQNVWNVSRNTKQFDENGIVLELIVNIFPTAPEIDFSEITLIEHMPKLNEADIEKSIEKWKKSNYMSAPLDQPRAVQNLDFLKLHIELMKGDGALHETIDIQLGKDMLIKSIEDKLIGCKVNDVIQHDDPALKITILDVQGSKNFEIDDMVKKFNLKNVEELHARFREVLKQEAMNYSKYLMMSELKQKLMDYKFEISHEFIAEKFKLLKSQILSDIGYKDGDDLPALIKEKMNLTMEELDTKVVILSEYIARLSFLLVKYAKQHDLVVKKEQVETAIASQVKHFNNNIDEAKKFFEENKGAKEMLEQNILEEMALSSITGLCKTISETHDIDKFYELRPATLDLPSEV